MRKYKKIIRLKPLDQRRFKFLYIFSLLLIFCLFGRLVRLQVFNASDLQRKARLIQSFKTNALKKRRAIVDRNNRLVAYDKRSINYGSIQNILIFLGIQLIEFAVLKKLQKNCPLSWILRMKYSWGNLITKLMVSSFWIKFLKKRQKRLRTFK